MNEDLLMASNVEVEVVSGAECECDSVCELDVCNPVDTDYIF